MAVTITATAAPADGYVDVSVAFTAGTVAAGTACTLERWTVVGGIVTALDQVLATWTRGAVDQTVIHRDASIPLQVERAYLVRAGGTPVAVQTDITLTSTGCWLTWGPHPQATMPIELQAWDSDDITARQTQHRVLRRRDVVTLGDVWDLPSGTLTILARDLDQADAVTTALTADVAAVQLRTQPDSLILSGNATYAFVPGSIRRRRLSGRSPDGRRLIDVDATGTRTYPAQLSTPLITLQQLAAKDSTLLALSALGTTLYDVATVAP